MFILIARKEITEIFRDGRFRWATGILLAFLLSSLLAGWRHYVEARALQEKAQQEERQLWLNKGDMNTHLAMHFGVYVYKPVFPLSVFDDGVSPYVGAYTHLEAHEQNLFLNKPAADEVPTRRVGQLAAAVCLQILLPLLIIMLGFSSFVGEREQGTLRQLLSLGVSKRDLITGKALGVAVPLMLVVVPASFVGSLGILLNSGGLLPDITQRLLVMTFSYILYSFIFLGLTLSVSMFASTSRQALLVLLAFWFFNCLMSPPVISDLGSALYPSPTSFEFAEQIKEEKSKKKHFTIRTMEIEQELLAKYNVSSVNDLPVNPGGIQALEEQKIDDEIYGRAFNRLYDSWRKQNALYQAGSLVAPMLSVQSLSMGLAGTDTEAHVHFAEAARRYRYTLETILNEDTAYNLARREGDRELWERLPPFTCLPPKVGWVLSNNLVGILILLAWSAFTLLAIRKAFARTIV